MAFEAEPIEDCVDSSVAAIDNMKETETELADLKAHILLLTEKLKGPSQPPPISMTLKLLI